MEKREQGKTITIKINGKHQAFDHNQQHNEDRIQQQVIEKSGSESKLSKEETKVVADTFQINDEVVTNETTNDKEARAIVVESKEDKFEWILPERSAIPAIEELVEQKAPQKTLQKKTNHKKSPSKWFSGKTKINRGIFATIFFAVFLAVILGTSFGFTMLKLVFIEKPIDSESALPVTSIPHERQTNTETTGAVVLTLPTISTWVVQAGAYSNSDSAKTEFDEIKDKGLSASIFEGEKSFILLGVADTKENAKALGIVLADSGINDPFSKEISAGGKELKGINDDEKTFLEGLPALFTTMTKSLSSDTIADADLKNINEQANMLKEISKIENKQIKSIKAHTDAAIKNINSIAKKPNKKQSTELQQHLLTILSTYQSLK